MEKAKETRRIMLYCIPFVLQVIIHVIASGGFEYSTLDDFPGRVLRGVLVTAFALLLGEGYGSIAFVLAGFYDRIGVHIAVIVLSAIGACASLVGYMFAGIEGLDSLWMTFLFWCTDIFLIIFSIVRIVKLSSKKA